MARSGRFGALCARRLSSEGVCRGLVTIGQQAHGLMFKLFSSDFWESFQKKKNERKIEKIRPIRFDGKLKLFFMHFYRVHFFSFFFLFSWCASRAVRAQLCWLCAA